MNSHNASKPPEPNAHLLEQVLSRPNMQGAWKRVKAKKGAAGVDNMAIDQFPEFARENCEGGLADQGLLSVQSCG
jgi:RNA-directed DNA polymerase